MKITHKEVKQAIDDKKLKIIINGIANRLLSDMIKQKRNYYAFYHKYRKRPTSRAWDEIDVISQNPFHIITNVDYVFDGLLKEIRARGLAVRRENDNGESRQYIIFIYDNDNDLEK